MASHAQEEQIQAVIFAFVRIADFVYRSLEKTAPLFARISLWPVILFFTPKINLVSFRNETAGIRFDDLILLTVATLLVGSWIVDMEFSIEAIPSATLLAVGVFCLSNLINIGHSNVLYSLRLAEYLVFFWSGKALVQSRLSFISLVKVLIAVNCAFIVLQYGGIVGGFTADGYESALDRPFGLSTNHPAEMGALLNLLFAALVFAGKTAPKFWYWCSIVALCIFFTGSRTALFAHCLLTLIYIYRNSKNRTSFVLKLAFVSGLLVSVVLVTPNPIKERSAALFSEQNFQTFRDLYDRIPVDKQFTGFAAGGAPEDAPEDVDASWYMRGFKWAQVIKIMLAGSWITWIFGVGPGALTPALDGGWLRVIGETGIVGALAFIVLLRKISNIALSCAMAVFALAVNMLMVDSHNAYKVMAFLFLLAGSQVQRQFGHSNLAATKAPKNPINQLTPIDCACDQT